MRFVLISDTHGSHRDIKIPDGDVLIHAGDILAGSWNTGQLHHINAWLEGLPHKLKIVVPGNHDAVFQMYLTEARKLLPAATILRDESLEYEGVKFYGTPWTPPFMDWYFMLNEKRLDMVFSLIPDDTDVLITHGPPRDILDMNFCDVRCGSFALWDHVSRVKPSLHVFGHIHEGYGQAKLNDTTYVNASVLGQDYIATNDPIIWDW